MKKRIQGILCGLLAGVLLTGSVVYAKQASESINVIYDNIKIMIDGKEYQPTDAQGNTVEPFIYNGTTYLPVRAIANAFDKEVDWEPQTSTVTLGSKNYDWLDQMGYVDYETTGRLNIFAQIPTGTVMCDGMKYDRGIYFVLRDNKSDNRGTIENNDGSLSCEQSISYLLNDQYTHFNATLASTKATNDGRAQLKIYGDGKLLYTSPLISNGTKSTNVDVDVSGVKVLKIYVTFVNISDSNASIYPALADARLEKK